MVPTLEARITRQMLYSAVPPIGIASARLAMLPPVQLQAGCCDTPPPERLRRRSCGTQLYFTAYSFLLNPLCLLAIRDASQTSVAEGLSNAPFIYASACVVKK